MPRPPKKGTGWYQYLETNGLLGADKETLEKARKSFHVLWKREWRAKQKGTGVKYYKPRFSFSDNKMLVKTATEYGIHPTQYIQQATIAKLHSTPLLPQQPVFRKIVQLLFLIHSEIIEHSGTSLFSLHDELQTMKARLTILEDWLKTLYYTPPTIPAIVQEALEKHPELLQTLKDIINACDQKHEPKDANI